MKKYIAIDGGTTNTRIMLICDGKICDVRKMSMGARSSGDDMSSYKMSLRAAIAELLDANDVTSGEVECIIASGMITSELGLYPVPHIVTPAGVKELHDTMCRTEIPDVSDIPFAFIRGVRTACDSLENADMMRGEEAEIMGLDSGDGACMYMLMGSHSKIIETDGEGRITAFCTMLTGELAESTANNTILKNSVVFRDTAVDPEFLKKGYLYCRDSGINETLFKTRILKNIFGGSDSAVYSFFMGAMLCGEIEYVIRKNPPKVIVGGNKKLRETVAVLLKEYFGGETLCLSDEAVERSNAAGMVRIFEFAD